MMKYFAAWTWIALLLAAQALPAGEVPLRVEAKLRRPVGLASVGEWLFVANRESGTISTVDATAGTVVDETRIGERLSSLAATPDGRYLLASDAKANELILIRRDERALNAIQRVPVSAGPIDVTLSSDGVVCSVASRWAHRVTLVRLEETAAGRRMSVLATVDLPIAPRRQWIGRDDSLLVVADASSAELAMVDLRARKLVAVRTFEGHNIGGLALDGNGRELLVSHQLLGTAVPATHSRVFWGTLMNNVLRSIPVSELLPGGEADPSADGKTGIGHWSLYPLGRPGNAAGDPGDVLVTAKAQTLVCLSGVGELATRSAPRQPFNRIAVESRPTRVVLDAGGKFAYAANTFADSVSVVDLGNMQAVKTIRLGPPVELDHIARGERLFHDARLALDGWFSCHSCHTDGHTNHLVNDNISDGSFGASKQIPTLLGVGSTGPWAWSGLRTDLEQQVHASITQSMHGSDEGASVDNVTAIAAYMRSLQAPPSVARARGTLDAATIARGRRVFEEHDCGTCHTTPSYTSTDAYDVDLRDAVGNARFNPPSLLGLSQRRRFFHDGSAKSVREVLRTNHYEIEGLSEDDLDDLAEFLLSL